MERAGNKGRGDRHRLHDGREGRTLAWVTPIPEAGITGLLCELVARSRVRRKVDTVPAPQAVDCDADLLAGEVGWTVLLLGGTWESRVVSPKPGSRQIHFPGTMPPSLFVQAHLGIQTGLGSIWASLGLRWRHLPNCLGHFSLAF